MVKTLLDEVRAAPLDEKSRVRLREIYEQSIRDLSEGLSPDLVAELERSGAALRQRDAERGRAAHRPGPTGGLARGPVPRDPGHVDVPADGGPGPARGDAAAEPAPGRRVRTDRAPTSEPPVGRGFSRPRRRLRSPRSQGPTRFGASGRITQCKFDVAKGGPVSERSFTHLHTHTEFSMLDGAARVGDLVAAAVADGQPALGITDHGNMYGVLDFYKACRDAGHHADHRDRGLHGRRVAPRAARAPGPGRRHRW